MDIAVIGAGLAGLSCAGLLAQAGLHVEVFDKGRGPGGRVATRRSDFGAFDHGAPVLHDLPQELLGRFEAHLVPRDGGVMATPRMSALPRAMEAALTVHQSARVVALNRRDGGWNMAMEGGRGTVMARKVLLCIPAPQVLDLLPGGLFATIAKVRMTPIWTLMMAFDTPLTNVDEVIEDEIFTALRQGTRAGRQATPERWVIHGTDAWSCRNVDTDRETVEARLADAFIGRVGQGAASHITSHRWLYGRTTTPAGVPCFWSDESQIGVAGDWCLGPRGGDAVRSGLSLAQEVLS